MTVEYEDRAVLCEASKANQPKKSLQALLLKMSSEFDDAILDRVQDKGRPCDLQ